MPSIRRNVPDTTADALVGLQFKTQYAPFLASLYVSGATEGDTVSFSVGSNQYLVNGQANVEAASGVVDTDRDQILFREMCPAGEMFMPMTLTADMQYLLVIETA